TRWPRDWSSDVCSSDLGVRSRNSHAAASPSPIGIEGLRVIARRAGREAERNTLVEVLERVGWNRAAASRILKIGYKTLLNKMSQIGRASCRERVEMLDG